MKIGERRKVYKTGGILSTLEDEMLAICACAHAMGCLMVLAKREDGAGGWQVYLYRPPKPKVAQ
jgi:hypothetical protein